MNAHIIKYLEVKRSKVKAHLALARKHTPTLGLLIRLSDLEKAIKKEQMHDTLMRFTPEENLV